MIYPPEPMDPTKDFFKEFVRHTIAQGKYLRAIDAGVNDHGPWQQHPPEKIESIGSFTGKYTHRIDDDNSEYYFWDRYAPY